MKLTAILFFLALSVGAQDKTFNLDSLYKKLYKSTADYKISDNSIDFLNKFHPNGYTVKFVGAYPKNLGIKNIKHTKAVPFIIIWEGVVNNSNTNATLKFENCQGWELDGKGIGWVRSVGSSGSQLLHITGKFNKDFYIHDINLDGGFNPEAGRVTGAAMLQLSSSYTADCNASNWSVGTVRIARIRGINAYDEFVYMLHFTRAAQNGYVPTGGDSLFITDCDFNNAGRDGAQPTGWKYVYIVGNRFANGGREKSSDHCSGFSLNEGNGIVIIEKNIISNYPQLVYSGPGAKTRFTGNKYVKGGINTNQAAYLKAGEYVFEGNTIEAPTAKEAVITADGATVHWDISNQFIGPKNFRYFNGGKSIEHPFVTTSTDTITVKTSATSTEPTKTQYFTSDGKELIVKP
jgi:hypothetical protein